MWSVTKGEIASKKESPWRFRNLISNATMEFVYKPDSDRLAMWYTSYHRLLMNYMENGENPRMFATRMVAFIAMAQIIGAKIDLKIAWHKAL